MRYTFAATGTFPTMSRAQLQSAITARGGRMSTSVNNTIDYLIVGSSPGSDKLNKARSLGIPGIAAADMMASLNLGDPIRSYVL